jgi:hypothetical protein
MTGNTLTSEPFSSGKTRAVGEPTMASRAATMPAT